MKRSTIVQFLIAMIVAGFLVPSEGTSSMTWAGGVAGAGNTSTWYWQNPLPRAYSMQSISCPSVTACMTVGQGGSIMTTSDGGHHWTSRRSGTTADLLYLDCPDRSVCYALGSTKGTARALDIQLKSVNGGATWSRPSPHLSLGAVEWGGATLVCPSITTCLLWSVTKGAFHILRTGDGGKTWRAARGKVAQGTGPITCPTTRICYAGLGHTVYRSLDAGATWSVWSRVPGNAAGNIGALVCLRASSCLAALDVCLDCGDALMLRPLSRVDASSQEWVDIFLTRDSGRTWRHAERGGNADAEFLVCGSVTRCYGTGAWTSDVLETNDGGQTWSSYQSHFSGNVQEVACPGTATCYAAAGFTALETTDGFHHVLQSPARSAVGGAMLGWISCPTAATCYANTFESGMVTTADGGKTWTVMPGRPMNYLSCPTSTTCYGYVLLYSGNGKPPEALFFRSTDGARSWQQFRVPVTPSSGPDIGGFACVAARTCYLLATTSLNSSPRLAFLVTTDGGARWKAKGSINRKAALGNPVAGGLSCPSVSTCFVALSQRAVTPGGKALLTLLGTRDGGDSWTHPSPVPCASSCGSDMGVALTCPTVSTCYVLSTGGMGPSYPPMAARVTHDAGATWHSARVSRGGYLTTIACSDALTCRVVASSGIYRTDNGGATWQQDVMEGKQPFPPDLTGIACPASGTCYAVGGQDILATDRGR